MKAKLNDWINATANLNKRRQYNGHSDDNIHCESTVTAYKLHIEKCGYGSSVIDVGCGSQSLKRELPEGVKYYGLDAFPLQGFDTIECAIEDLKGWTVDTCFAFAILDNCRDFFEACDSMKRTAQRNIGILTGIDIEVDEFHTFKLQLTDFEKAFSDWKCTYKEELQPKVWLLNYEKI